jgi:hypothetical protein
VVGHTAGQAPKGLRKAREERRWNQPGKKQCEVGAEPQGKGGLSQVGASFSYRQTHFSLLNAKNRMHAKNRVNDCAEGASGYLHDY